MVILVLGGCRWFSQSFPIGKAHWIKLNAHLSCVTSWDMCNSELFLMKGNIKKILTWIIGHSSNYVLHLSSTKKTINILSCTFLRRTKIDKLWNFYFTVTAIHIKSNVTYPVWHFRQFSVLISVSRVLSHHHHRSINSMGRCFLLLDFCEQSKHQTFLTD